jgi:hypothetical protein
LNPSLISSYYDIGDTRWQSHSPSRFRIDLAGVDAGPDYRIVAARTGTIRFIVDTNVEPTDDNIVTVSAWSRCRM